MGSFTNYLENSLLNHTFKVSSFAQPTNVYIALSTASVADAATGVTEPPTPSGYARTVMNTWSTSTTGVLFNSAAVTFTAATGPWGTVTDFGVFDASTGGNLLAYGTLTVPKTPTSGDILQFSPSSIMVRLD